MQNILHLAILLLLALLNAEFASAEPHQRGRSPERVREETVRRAQDGKTDTLKSNKRIEPKEEASSTQSPALKGSPYHSESVASRVKPEYKTNPAHDPKSPYFDKTKTPEPSDAVAVYEKSSRSDMGTWFGKGEGGWYRYSSDNAGSVHFSGTVPKSNVPNWIKKGK